MPYRNYSGVRRKVSTRMANRYDRRSVVSKAVARTKRSYVKKIAKKTMLSLAEKKFLESDESTAVSINYNGTIYSDICDVPQGDGDMTRDGDQITPTSLRYSIHVGWNHDADVTKNSNIMRVILFRWHPFEGDVAPTVSKILYTVGATYSCIGPFVHDGRNQFDVLLDRTVVLDYQKQHALIQGTMPLKKKIQWKAANTTNGTGRIYALYISDAVAASGIYPEIVKTSFRLNYNDS